jgi:hypothetical protein
VCFSDWTLLESETFSDEFLQIDLREHNSGDWMTASLTVFFNLIFDNAAFGFSQRHSLMILCKNSMISFKALE